MPIIIKDINYQMEISKEDIATTFGRGLGSKPSESPSGITARGPTMLQAYKSWLVEASHSLVLDALRTPSNSATSNSASLQFDQLQLDELISRKLVVGEVTLPNSVTVANKQYPAGSNRKTTPVTASAVAVYIIDCGEREVIICPYKNEVALAEKNSVNPVISLDGNEMKVPGFVVDHRVVCTRVYRTPILATPAPISNNISPITVAIEI